MSIRRGTLERLVHDYRGLVIPAVIGLVLLVTIVGVLALERLDFVAGG